MYAQPTATYFAAVMPVQAAVALRHSYFPDAEGSRQVLVTMLPEGADSLDESDAFILSAHSARILMNSLSTALAAIDAAGE